MPVARCVQLAARIARYYRATADPVELAQRCTGPNRPTTGLGCGRLRPPAWWWSISWFGGGDRLGGQCGCRHAAIGL